MAAPKEILDLVEKFSRNREEYMSPSFNEATLRQEFLNPFFRALGWDVDNTQGHAMAYREVIHEDQVKVGDATKAPDYAFRVGGQRKFFVEAKKPAINIEKDPGPAYQLRRYAWSAGLPVSILTDFEQFAVYDTRIKPDPKDKAGLARVMLVNCAEFAEKWDEIAAIFSKTAVYQGAFDKYADAHKKRGQLTVDADFLSQIEKWREALAKNLKLRNAELGVDDLNFAVGKIIDRIIFLRVCEGRGIETTHSLQALLNGENAYPRLLEIFRWADDKYNSGLFHFKKEKGRPESPDELTTAVEVDDKVIKEIVKGLYIDSPYEFSVLPVEILGQIYEQFLGKVIVATDQRAHVEEKPEVRKAGGVYYTPRYIVDYIVENTVGKLLEGKTPKNAADLKILDPACGSGSFLLGAYQYLLNWHRKWYAEHDPEKLASGKSPVVFKGPGGDWRLTASEKKRILLNNIHGVDIDRQAVEVTKLSLLLQVLEGETAETLGNQKKLFQERALPDLGGNIKCGNSLIGWDFFEGQLSPDPELVKKINPFDWEREFPEIMKKAGGFDAVIGNPPYLFITEVPQEQRNYYENKYKSISYRFDLYGAFIELCAAHLLRAQACFGFIIPHTLLSNDSFKKLRQLLTAKTNIYQVVDLGPGVFQGARNETMLLFFKVGRTPRDIVFAIRSSTSDFPKSISEMTAKQNEWAPEDGAPWLHSESHGTQPLLKKIDRVKTRLGELCTINQGLRTGDNEKYLSDKQPTGKWRHAAGGKHIGRYEPLKNEIYVYYEPSVLDAPRNENIFKSDSKIVVQEIRNITLKRRIIATYDDEQYYCLQSTNVINLRKGNSIELHYILGVLNSALINYYFKSAFQGNNHIPANQLAKIPIVIGHKIEGQISNLVKKILSLNHQFHNKSSTHQSETVKRQIDATDRQIDALVYELYGLTDEEIKIVEGA